MKSISRGAAALTIDIVIRTYFRDFRWLRAALKSVMRFATGHRRIIVVMPRSSLDRLPADLAAPSAGVTLLTCAEYEDDYLGQQITKLSADRLSDADALAHIDSDCLFWSPCDLHRLLTEHGCIIIRHWRRSPRTATDGWRACVADFFGEPLPFDALVTPPLLFPRDLYGDLRKASLSLHGCLLETWALGRRADTLSEFGLLAAAAWFWHRERFVWRDADDEVTWPCRQYWSRAPALQSVEQALVPDVP